jgi:murein DD-endopeptidase MepM/ murein hydrolase activator NlpD
MFRQYQSDVQAGRRDVYSSRRNQTAEELSSSLTIYVYVPQENDNLQGIAARCNIPIDTIASLNRFSNMEDPLGTLMLLPSHPGIFIPETPGNDLERLLISSRADRDPQAEVLLSIPRNGKTEQFRFVPGDNFSSTERIFFLNRGFRFPLKDFRVTSSYGPRINPVTGRPGMHQGLDLAAPEGTEVFAARGGTVIDLGEDRILGKYIILRHDNNWQSLYGHLSAINTTLYAEVLSGGFIGRVGSTGHSTGPHLHFELRQGGQTRDPARHFGIRP